MMLQSVPVLIQSVSRRSKGDARAPLGLGGPIRIAEFPAGCQCRNDFCLNAQENRPSKVRGGFSYLATYVRPKWAAGVVQWSTVVSQGSCSLILVKTFTGVWQFFDIRF